MKKNLFAFLLLPALLTLASCNKSGKSQDDPKDDPQDDPIVNQEEVDELKALLNKQDLSEFYGKAMGTMFQQEYEVLDVDRSEDEIVTSNFTYTGVGFLDMYYDITKDTYDALMAESGNVNTFDALASGIGGYRIKQLVNTSLDNQVGEDEKEERELGFNQEMTVKSLDNDILVYNSLLINDSNNPGSSQSQSLNSSINKELLFNSISVRSFRDIFSQVDLFDSPGNVEYIDRLYFATCRELKNSTDKEISNFIIDNQIVIEEKEEIIELSFVFPNEDLDEEYQEYIFPGEIEGKLQYDKETGAFNEFEYNINYSIDAVDEETGSEKHATMKFNCAGKSAREPLGDLWTPDDPTIYDDVIQFLEDVENEVVPPSVYQ